jgi:hypothetical protein
MNLMVMLFGLVFLAQNSMAITVPAPSPTPVPAPVLKFYPETVAMSFQSWIRVEVAATVVQSDDASIQGQSLPFHQSLYYTGSKSLAFTGEFNTEAELIERVKTAFCKQLYSVDLTPQREAGAKGTRKFTLNLLPFYVTVKGTRKVDDKVFSMDLTHVCQK